MSQINGWWKNNVEEGKTSVITAYALGKAQRIISQLDPSIGKIFTHGAIENTNQVIRNQGIELPATYLVTDEYHPKDFIGNIIIAPPSAMASPWMKRFKNTSTAMASGWMAMRGTRRRRASDKGFILSDHADWQGLNNAIISSEAENVFVTHGYTDIFTKWLTDQGVNASVVKTEFLGEQLNQEG
jgi:putative mRNA 3-end processing factor